MTHADLAWLLICGVLGIGSVFFYRWLFRTSGHRVASDAFQMGDIVAASVFGAMFLALIGLWIFSKIWLAAPADTVITFDLLIQDSAVRLGMILFVLGFLIFRGIDPVRAFGLRWKGWPWGLLIVAGCLLVILPVIFFFQILSHKFFVPGEGSQAAIRFFLDNPTPRDRLAFIVLALVVAPVTEEFFFRGYLYGVARKYAGRGVAILLMAFLFAAIHMHLSSMPALFCLAVALGIVYEKTGSLWAAMLMHAGFNSISVIFLFNWPELAT